MRIDLTANGAESITAGYISYQRLAQHLKDSVELRKGEVVVAFEVTTNGLKYFVENEELS